MADWRLQGQERYLRGVALAKHRYKKPREDWDHDHCAFCWAKFMVGEYPDALHLGYATEDDYHWICNQCYEDFREQFEWKVVQATGD